MSAATTERSYSRWMELVAAFIAINLTACVVIITMLPYLGYIPSQVEPSIVANHESLIQNAFIMIVSYFFNTAVNNRRREQDAAPRPPPPKPKPVPTIDPIAAATEAMRTATPAGAPTP